MSYKKLAVQIPCGVGACCFCPVILILIIACIFAGPPIFNHFVATECTCTRAYIEETVSDFHTGCNAFFEMRYHTQEKPDKEYTTTIMGPTRETCSIAIKDRDEYFVGNMYVCYYSYRSPRIIYMRLHDANNAYKTYRIVMGTFAAFGMTLILIGTMLLIKRKLKKVITGYTEIV